MKKFLITLTAVIMIPAVFAACVILNGHYFPSRDDIGGRDMSSWMAYVDDGVPISELIMPGSHDAGTCTVNWLGRTQGYSVADQLNMGARYFDLRVNKTVDGYFMYHSMFDGERFDDVLSAITSFISEKRTETLILDFQHFKGGSKPDVLAMLEDALVERGLAVENGTEMSDLEYISTVSLGDVRGRCVILFGGGDELAAEHGFIFSRNDDGCTRLGQALNSCYIGEYNKMGSRDFIETALPFYYRSAEEKIGSEGFKGLFVLQGQLTDGLLIFGPYSKEKSHGENMSNYISSLAEDAELLSLTNIIMRDFLTEEKCAEIISLNLAKGNVKNGLEGELGRLLSE